MKTVVSVSYEISLDGILVSIYFLTVVIVLDTNIGVGL